MQTLEVFNDYGMIEREIIEAFERDCGYCFPEEYKNLLSQHNALYPIQNCFDFINKDQKLDSTSFAFLGYGSATELIEDSQDFDVYGYDGIVAFGCNGCGDYICFDYRQDPKTDNPPVVLMHHDEYIEDEQGQYKMAIAKIANSFDEFIDMLYKYIDE